MGSIGRKILGTIVGLVVMIGIWEVKSRLGGDSSSSSDEGAKVTQQDVDTYLRVMRATAERIQNPQQEELDVVNAFSQIPNARTAQANQLTPAQKETIFDAQRLTSSLDFVVADELQIGAEEYEGVKYTIEEYVPPPEAPGDAAELTEAQRKVLESRAAVLVPHVGEIRQLQRTLFDNPLRKTVYGE